MREAAVLSVQRAAYFLPHAGQSLDLQENFKFMGTTTQRALINNESFIN